MVTVVAIGGNALLKRGEPLEAVNQHKNVKAAAQSIAAMAQQHSLVIVHGNGPQVGLLALQAANYSDVKPYPLDILNAETQGMIGYLLQQEIGNAINDNRSVTTLLTQVLVDKHDRAFQDPSKPIGQIYTHEQATLLAQQYDWVIKPDGKHFRRVVPSPEPQQIIELEIIQSLIAQKKIVICAGGGGIPVIQSREGKLEGVEGVIDKDLSAAVLAISLQAESLVILTDVPNVIVDWGTDHAKPITEISINSLANYTFAAGSMGPKIKAACRFVEQTKRVARIGALQDGLAVLNGTAGTLVHI